MMIARVSPMVSVSKGMSSGCVRRRVSRLTGESLGCSRCAFGFSGLTLKRLPSMFGRVGGCAAAWA